jgi:hypothetical protein
MRRLGPGRESLGEEAGGRDTERTGTDEDGGGGAAGGTAIIAAQAPRPPRSAVAAVLASRCS